MKLKVIACEVLARPLYFCAAQSPHIVDIILLRRGLHNTPANLRAQLQSDIDEASDQGYDALLFGYGLCGQATAGLVARNVQLIVPRAHDCITLFLGSRERYKEQFEKYPGTYWYAHDYMERDDGSGSALSLGSGTDTDLDNVYGEYVEKYGKENADYLMEVMGAWQKHYQRAVYIDMGVGDGSAVKERAQNEANRRGWIFEEMAGELLLLKRMINGDWERGDDFLVVPPGAKISMSYDERVIDCFRNK